MMHIYLDLSSTIQNHFVSGIQRVVREVVSYMLLHARDDADRRGRGSGMLL